MYVCVCVCIYYETKSKVSRPINKGLKLHVKDQGSSAPRWGAK